MAFLNSAIASAFFLFHKALTQALYVLSLHLPVQAYLHLFGATPSYTPSKIKKQCLLNISYLPTDFSISLYSRNMPLFINKYHKYSLSL